MNWQGKKILITGASGFIGSHLTEEMVRQGAKVRAMVHYNGRNDWGNLEWLPLDIKKSIEVILGDVQDPFFVRNAVKNNEVVFHLAALIAIPYSYIAPQSYVSTNINGTLNVLQACLDEKIERVVHTSTSEVYGTAIYTPIDEKHPLQGQSPYSASKIAADKIAESYYRSFNLPVVTLRPFNTYGPRQSARAIIPTIISQALTRDHIEIGSTDPVRDLTFVKDTVRGFMLAASTEKVIGEEVSVGNGAGITIGDLAAKIMKLMKKDIPVVSKSERHRPSKSEVMKLICDNRKAKLLMDWEPQFSLDQGLEETIHYITDNIRLFKTDQYVV